VASILLVPVPPPCFRIAAGQNIVVSKKNRLKEIQDQLDLLMDELHRIRHRIDDQESRRRTYPFPFERGMAPDTPPPPPPTKTRVRGKKKA
jgi:hypothetical protein